MKTMLKTSIAMAAVAAASLIPVANANAADLWGRGARGSIKDTYVPPPAATVSRCYVRGDVGYSLNRDPDTKFESYHYGTRYSDDSDLHNSWLLEAGIGCGSGSRGLRADFTFGYRFNHDLNGAKPDAPGFHYPAEYHTKLSTFTGMANLYYDFGMFRGFVPYVGAGIGFAHHNMGNVSFDNINSGGAPYGALNDIRGGERTNFAWSLMAGAAYQISERAVLDFGYRYIDMGKVSSKLGSMCNTCVAGGSLDTFKVDDLKSHEFKVGLRYHFGGREPLPYK